MTRWNLLELLSLPVTLYALTGGFGRFVPRIAGLSNCADFNGDRLILILLVTCLLGFGALVSCVLDKRGIAVRLGLAGALVFTSGIVNHHLDQDPVAAQLNWQAPGLRIDPQWGREITSHEFLFYSERQHLLYAGGAGRSIPPEVQDEYPGMETF